MVIRAVLFDIGGVLAITPDLGVSRRWEHQLALTAGRLDQRMADVWAGGAIGALGEDQVLAAVRERLSLDQEQADAFMADIWRQYLGAANEALIEYVRGLRPQYRTGIISNSFAGARERERAAYGFEDLVDVVVYSNEAGMLKPDPRIYALACDRLGVRPQEAAFVDDAEQCVAGARTAGMHAVLFRDNAQAIREICRLLTASQVGSSRQPPSHNGQLPPAAPSASK